MSVDRPVNGSEEVEARRKAQLNKDWWQQWRLWQQCVLDRLLNQDKATTAAIKLTTGVDDMVSCCSKQEWAKRNVGRP